MHFWSGEYHMGPFPFGFIVMFVFWALVIWAVVALIRGIKSGGGGRGQGESAEDIVKKRYARGEISKEEYRQLLADLRSPEP